MSGYIKVTLVKVRGAYFNRICISLVGTHLIIPTKDKTKKEALITAKNFFIKEIEKLK